MSRGSFFIFQVYHYRELREHENLDLTKVYVNLANEDIQASHVMTSPLVNLMNNKRVSFRQRKRTGLLCLPLLFIT
jgi:hypothetical protein